MINVDKITVFKKKLVENVSSRHLLLKILNLARQIVTLNVFSKKNVNIDPLISPSDIDNVNAPLSGPCPLYSMLQNHAAGGVGPLCMYAVCVSVCVCVCVCEKCFLPSLEYPVCV